MLNRKVKMAAGLTAGLALVAAVGFTPIVSSASCVKTDEFPMFGTSVERTDETVDRQNFPMIQNQEDGTFQIPEMRIRGGMKQMAGMQGEKPQLPQMPQGQMPQMQGQFPGQMNQGGPQGNVSYADSASEIVTSTVTNTAAALVADQANATTIVMSDSENEVKIDTAGTYIVTGTCADGNITVKKGTTGVVLILKDLDLTSTTGATVSLNKNTEVKVIVEGTVNLTDAENPADEESTDAEVADAFDGAALKAKDGSNVYLTGTGTLNIDASSCKNGIKVGDAENPSFVIDGGLTININAANDGLNAGYDLTILSGTLNITAGDDAVHADRILTVGSDNGSGPTITVRSAVEGLEGTVVNIFGGNISVNTSDDGINAANSDATYASEMAYSVNITGGTVSVKAGADGLDSNGNVNITGGQVTINSASVGGENGIDYDGSLYVADSAKLTNNSGVSGPDGMNGMMGQMPQMNGHN